MPVVGAAHLEDLLLGIEKMSAKTIINKDSDSTVDKHNPHYFSWVTRDQSLLSYLFSSEKPSDQLLGLIIMSH
jgi:hypothetical protein